MSEGSRYRTQALGGEDELSVDVMRFFAVIAVCLFSVLSVVGSSRGTTEMQSVKTGNFSEITTEKELTGGSASNKTDQLKRLLLERRTARTSASAFNASAGKPIDTDPPLNEESSQGLRFLDEVAFEEAVLSGAVTLWKIEDKYQYQFQVQSKKLQLRSPTSDLLFTIDAADVRSFLAKLNGVRESDIASGNWYITLPRTTLNQIGRAARKTKGWMILDERASLISAHGGRAS
jgi:hypothetical protein